MSTITINAEDLTVTRELKISVPDMRWLAEGLLAATATNEAYGVICHAHLAADGLSAIAEATDKYRIHQMHLALRAPIDPVDVVIPHDALVWAKKNVRTFVPKKDSLIEPVAILEFTVPAIREDSPHAGWVSVIYREWDDDNAPSARFDAPLIADAYPSTSRVVDGIRMAPVGEPSPLVLDFIADARALQTAHTETPTIAYTVSETTGRPGPVLIDFWESSVLRATAVIQPSASNDEEDVR
ncbi:hypothetical protein RS84_00223 [Microbacterium hydrocarbonoxydans]|uniref:Uncharacterized protein n=1 Tax=Microbacterium hydrocarbonoxydans TaxID=273678 RepID=A0A0M2HX57_9MICO|nr:hypothetical protein [Microbacterium hydrocarbonoxydans]KJL49510.1 hypothetical protein RS84_00223 [Microbacterium hydrocarbonoxydans]